ncbi:MAG: hypothetical protein AN487_24090 [Anabaena sp. CRKS33]|nr:MAG: hypothetical protein AN487_24090 [Anabaena sp. CRKS33]
MRVGVAPEPLNAHVAHVTLLEPHQTLAGVANCARVDEPILAPGHTIDAVGRGYGRRGAGRNAPGERHEFEFVEDRAACRVVDDRAAELPAGLRSPLAADGAVQIADLGV